MFSRLIQLSRKLFVPLGWTLLTQILLSLPGSLFSGPGLLKIPHLDKLAHLVLFGGLSIFWLLFYYFRQVGLKKSTSLIVLLVITAYGIAVEFFQVNFIPNRSFDTADIAADICGAVCGYFATIGLLRTPAISRKIRQ